MVARRPEAVNTPGGLGFSKGRTFRCGRYNSRADLKADPYVFLSMIGDGLRRFNQVQARFVVFVEVSRGEYEDVIRAQPHRPVSYPGGISVVR